MSRSREVVRGVVNTEIVADKTVREIEQINTRIQKEIVRRGGIAAIKAGLSEQIGIPQDVAIAAMIVWRNIGRFRYTDKGTQLTIGELNAIAEETRGLFIEQHVLNYAAFYLIQGYYDWLVEKNLIARFSKTENYWRKLEREFQNYEQDGFGRNEQVSQMVFKDFVTQSFGNIEPLTESLEVAVRDYLIQHRAAMVAAGQKDDIAQLQKAVVCLYFLSLMQKHYVDFFMEIVQEHGVDFSAEFRYADLHKMTLNFVYMCEAQGMKFATVDANAKHLIGVEVEKSTRVNGILKAITDTLRNDELSDETTGRAIAMNPKFDEIYPDIAAEDKARREKKKQQEMEEGFKMLEEKYKVTRTE